MANYNPITPISHREWINDIMSDEQYNEEVVRYQSKNGIRRPYPDSYEKAYDMIAYNSFSEPGGTVTKCCVNLKITKQTFDRWVKRHPSFKIAVATGGLIGEDAFRDKIVNAAFEPGKDVNNRLIEMIGRNVYGIKVDSTPQVIINAGDGPVKSSEESARLYAEAIERKDEFDVEIQAESVEDFVEEPEIKLIN